MMDNQAYNTLMTMISDMRDDQREMAKNVSDVKSEVYGIKSDIKGYKSFAAGISFAWAAAWTGVLHFLGRGA